LDCVDFDGRDGTRLGRSRGIARVVRKLEPDVVLVARLFDAYAAVCDLKRRGREIRLATTVQAYEPEYLADLAAYAPFIDLCVTSGRLIVEAIKRFADIPLERVCSIPGGARSPLRAKSKPVHETLRLGYVGRLDAEQKRVLDLVAVLRLLRDAGVLFHCTIAGAGPAQELLRQALREAGVEGQVTFRGWLSVEELYRDVYPNLDVLLHFAAWEGITIAPREAMAHGVVPVVSKFVGCLAEGHFRHGENALLFDVGDVGGAAWHVSALARDRQALARLADGAMRSETGIYSEEGALDAWAAALTACLENPLRRQEKLPALPFPPPGRLERYGVPPQLASFLRRASGRRPRHHDPGSEWPHWSGLWSKQCLEQIRRFGTDYERATLCSSARPREL
jgi:hypothetical protein